MKLKKLSSIGIEIKKADNLSPCRSASVSRNVVLFGFFSICLVLFPFFRVTEVNTPFSQ